MLVDHDKRGTGPFTHPLDAIAKSNSIGHRILLSIVLLCEALSTASHRIYHQQLERHRSNFTSLTPSLLCDRLRAVGWCPWQIESLEAIQNLDCSTLYALSMMDRRALQKDHSKCSVDKCYGYDVNYETYTSKHVSRRCKCAFLPPEGSSVPLCVSWILDDGGLPLLSLSEGGESPPYLSIKYSSLVSLT